MLEKREKEMGELDEIYRKTLWDVVIRIEAMNEQLLQMSHNLEVIEQAVNGLSRVVGYILRNQFNETDV